VSDDSPFQSIQLPFPFLFNGRYVPIVFASPNGALHYSKDQPCYPYNQFAVENYCDFDNSYYDLIGGYLTDLDPYNCQNSTASVNIYKHRVEIEYSQFCYFGSSLQNSFRISLYDDDHIVLDKGSWMD
jgi:hypothetical protein